MAWETERLSSAHVVIYEKLVDEKEDDSVAVRDVFRRRKSSQQLLAAGSVKTGESASAEYPGAPITIKVFQLRPQFS